MSTLRIEQNDASAHQVKLTADTLTVDLSDGRTISVPLAWFPRLLHGSPAERSNWRFIARGEGIHWKDLDEDVSIEDLLHGLPSRESHASLEKWLAKRSSRHRTPNTGLQPSAMRARRSSGSKAAARSRRKP